MKGIDRHTCLPPCLSVKLLQLNSLFVVLLFTTIVAGCESGSGSHKDLKSCTDHLAAKIKTGLTANQKVAVLDFVSLEALKPTRVGKILAENLMTALAEKIPGESKITILERRLVHQAVTELKFQLSDLVNPEKAVAIGEYLGATIIVTGTLSDLGESYVVNGRAIEVKTVRVIAAVTTELSKSAMTGKTVFRMRSLLDPKKMVGISIFVNLGLIVFLFWLRTKNYLDWLHPGIGFLLGLILSFGYSFLNAGWTLASVGPDVGLAWFFFCIVQGYLWGVLVLARNFNLDDVLGFSVLLSIPLSILTFINCWFWPWLFSG